MGNELKLSLENFQSISSGELIFHKGINIIIGQSNSGKSATFRALKACLINPSGSQRFIKKGTKSSTVTLEYEGNQITWRRTPKESSYIINGELCSKTGSSNAFKITENTGFVLSDDNIIMNIEEELQLPFPFGISKSELFKLYENVFCVSDSSVILKSAKEQEDKVKTDISSLEFELSKNENKLKELKEFKEEFDLPKLKRMRDILKTKQDRIDFLSEGLPVIKKAIKAETLGTNDLEKTSFKEVLSEYKSLICLKKEVEKIKMLHKVSKELPNSTEFNNLQDSYEKALKFKKEINILKEIEVLEVPVVTFINKLENYQELKEYRDSLKKLSTDIKLKKEKEKNIKDKIKSIEERLKGFDVCPLCHRPFKEGD